MPFLPGQPRRRRAVGGVEPRTGPTPRSCTSGRAATTRAAVRRPTRQRGARRFDVGQRDVARARRTRARGRSRSGCQARREDAVRLHPAVNATCTHGFTLLRAPAPAAGRPRAARRLPVRHQGGLLPALLGRDGAAAADGRRARRAWRPASARAATPSAREAWIVRDTDAHAWVEAWFDTLGWVTFDPTPDATPARSQIAALAGGPPPPAAPPAGGAGAAPGAAASGAARSAACAPTCCSTAPARRPGGAAGAARRRRPAWWVVGAARARCAGRARRCWRCRAPRARPRGRCRRWTARSPSSSARCAAPGARCRPARRCASSSSGSAPRPRRAPTCARSAPAATRRAARRRPRAERRALRRALAQGLGLRRARARAVGAAAAARASARRARASARRQRDARARRRVPHLGEDALEARLGRAVDVRHRRGDRRVALGDLRVHLVRDGAVARWPSRPERSSIRCIASRALRSST